MLSTEEVLDTLSQNISILMGKYYIERIGIFGSYATGRQTEESDIDFVVQFRSDCPHLFDVKFNLKEYLHSLFGKDVDVANLKFIKPFVWGFIEPEIRYVD
jgi:hypothetical protein